MIEISISRELAAEHPGFMASCARARPRRQCVRQRRARSSASRNDRRCDGPGPRGRRGASARSIAGRQRPTGDEPEPGGGRQRSSPAYAAGAKSNREEALVWPEASPAPSGAGHFNVPVNASAPELLSSGADRDPHKEDHR